MLAMEEDDLINQFLTNPMGSISEVSGVGQGQGGPFLASSFQPLWSQSYMHRASPAKTHVGQNQADEFALHGEGVQDKGIALGKRSLPEDIRDNNIYSSGMNLQMPLPVTPGTALQQNHNGNPQMPQLVQGSSLNHQSNGVISHPQSTTVAANGTARPRVRARRGQATDPHSIAERLRRERISERMKSLQELVPNSNKTDKASMLDEIIDHVRFLQMQVKVLSASRLGGAGAILPQIADLSSRGSGSQASMSVSQDGASFEQTVATLLESDMTAAMQLLQNKGLCLMPIAMATAISGATRKPVTSSITTGSVHGTSNSEKKFTGLSEGTCLAVTGIGSQSSSSPEGSGEKPFAYDNN